MSRLGGEVETMDEIEARESVQRDALEAQLKEGVLT
jgi:hypothetical protein